MCEEAQYLKTSNFLFFLNVYIWKVILFWFCPRDTLVIFPPTFNFNSYVVCPMQDEASVKLSVAGARNQIQVQMEVMISTGTCPATFKTKCEGRKATLSSSEHFK